MRRLQRVLVFVNKPTKVSSSYAKFHSSILLQDKNRSENFNKLYQTVLELNSTAETYQAIEAYEELKSKHLYELDVQHYTEIIDSFAPRKLMFGFFKHYKDFVDMYYDAGFVNSSKRMQEARIVFDDISRSPLNLVPSLATYHAMMKTQLSCGMGNVLQVFNTYNQLQTQPNLNATMTTYNTLLRACSLLERDDVAEEIFVFALSRAAHHKKNNILTEEKATGSKNVNRSPVITQSKPIPRTQEILNPANEVSMQFYNTMLDVYAESRNFYAFRFFEILLEKEMPINAVTLNTYAKACIFMDFREKLSKLPELMRVRGILHRELSAPVRKEITDAYKYYTTPFNYKNKLYMKVASGHPLPQGEDPYDNLRDMQSWGREIDLRDYKFLNLIKPNLDKWAVDLDKMSKPKDPNFYVTRQTQDENPAEDPVYNIPFRHML